LLQFLIVTLTSEKLKEAVVELVLSQTLDWLNILASS
jgi:hypothetical protein